MVPASRTTVGRGVQKTADSWSTHAMRSRGAPFGPMAALLSVAEYVTKLHAICSRCGAAACRSQRLIGIEGQLFVGGAADYEPRCRRCFVAEPVDARERPPSRHEPSP